MLIQNRHRWTYIPISVLPKIANCPSQLVNQQFELKDHDDNQGWWPHISDVIIITKFGSSGFHITCNSRFLHKVLLTYKIQLYISMFLYQKSKLSCLKIHLLQKMSWLSWMFCMLPIESSPKESWIETTVVQKCKFNLKRNKSNIFKTRLTPYNIIALFKLLKRWFWFVK